MKKLLVILSLKVTLLFGLNTNLKATTIKNEENSQTQLANQFDTKVNKYGGYLNIFSNKLKKVRESVYYWYRIVGPQHHKKRLIIYSTGINGMYLNDKHKIDHHIWNFGIFGFGHKENKYVNLNEI